ncbi:MAG: sugar transferase [Clostridiaceae bacterium]|nr:sugar transferase [Clostridiaceae bacterium]
MDKSKPIKSQPSVANRRRSAYAHVFKLLYIVVELMIVNLSLIAAFYIIYDRELETFNRSFNDYLLSTPLMMLAAIIYIDYFGMTHFFRKTRTDIVSASVRFVFLEIVTAAAIAFFFKYFAFPRYVMLLGSGFMLLGTILWSVACLHISKCIYNKGKIIIIAVSHEDADHLYIKLRNQLRELHIEYMGYTLAERGQEQIFRLIDRCTEVLVSPAISETDKSQIFLYCANLDKTVYIVPQFSDLVYTRFRVVQFHDMPTFMIDSLGLTFQQRMLKRAFDIVFAILALIITGPVQLATMLLIRIDSPGPAVYSQDRITLSGKVYKVYKFRTMVNGAEEKFGAYQSSLDDPRVTKIGKLLRNMHLDELPQFVNIIRGDMSVVGPRSDRPTTIDAFETNIPGYNQRLKVKSGLTGLAQIYGKYNSDPEDKLRFDMMYIKNYSFLLDMKIIMQSLRAILPQRNNYNEEESAPENHEFEMRI